MAENEVDILISSKDRATEIAVLMQSLRTQTFKNWNLYILDNASGTQLSSFTFIGAIMNRLRLEGHKVKIIRNNLDYGICYARNLLNELQLKEGTGNLSMRLDDDVIPETDYIEKLISVIDKGYDIASGVTPLCGVAEWKRENKFLNGEINRVRLNEKGDIEEFSDDCGYCYIDSEIIRGGHFRSCALYKSELNKIKYPDNLSKYGFREESFFSLKSRMAGYKIGIHTGAVVYHLQTPSGGGRPVATPEAVQSDDLTFRNWVKKKYLIGELRV